MITEAWPAWGAARVDTGVLQLETAACGRPSRGTFDAVRAHIDLEQSRGGYPAEDLVYDRVQRLRQNLATLLGTDANGIALVESGTAGLHVLLNSWMLPDKAQVGLVPGEWGPTIDAFTHWGVTPVGLAVDEHGVLDLERLAQRLATDPPDLIHLDHLASHRGLVQPVEKAQQICRDHGVPLWVDAAQSFGHLDSSFGADAIYAPSRKWLAGPRGSAVVAIAAQHRPALRPFQPSSLPNLTAVQMIEEGEAAICARMGFDHAVRELLSLGPARVFARLADVGATIREMLGDLPGWSLADTPDAVGAIVSLRPTDGQDPEVVQRRLLEEHKILVTACEPWRAPAEMAGSGSVIRLSPHVDLDEDDVRRVAKALRER